MFATAAALPLVPNQILDGLQSNDINAYNLCLGFEKSAPAGSNALIHARVLGYLIIHSPSRAALHEVVKAIHSCAGDHAKLFQLGQSFIDYFIRPFKKFKSRTPIPSDHSSRPSFDKSKYVRPTVVEAPRTHREAKDLALLWDGFRCVVTGTYDGNTLSEVPDLPSDASAVYTVCVQIVPESTYFDVSSRDSGDGELDYAALVLAVLRCFGYDTEKFSGAKAHSLFNVMTVQRDIQDFFDRLEIWFEKTEVVNSYRIRAISKHYRVPKEIITFTTPDSENLPVPAETLLVLHAACAQVAQLSGAAQYIDRLDRDAEDLGVLACDGSSGEVLTSALLSRMNKIIGIGA